MLGTRGTVVSHCSVHLCSCLIKLSKFTCFLENTIYPIRKTSQQPNFQDEDNLLLRTLLLLKISAFYVCIAFDKLAY